MVRPDGGCLMGVVLSIDFGTSNTAAVLCRGEGRAEPLLFDGSPLLRSAVFAQPDGSLLTGRDAFHSLRLAPERFEPNPKLRVDDGVVLLGAEIPVAAAFAAVLGRVANEAGRIAGEPIERVVLTHPAGWGTRRRAVIGLLQTIAKLTIDPGKLTVERRSGTPRTTTIRWDSVQRVSVIGELDAARLVVWYLDGHQPDASLRGQIRFEDGWVVCLLDQVTLPSSRADQLTEIRTALAQFAGDRYAKV
ncbi:hypothetical protein [Dactylosporangium sp. CA-233914]|uniref:hypothetical protein n=1 Tax=Dactylosporangium sp. CA-233914 TaxID=3239934 RepID=UPI003D949C65